MTVETVVRKSSIKSNTLPLVPQKIAQKQWIAQIKQTSHSQNSGLNPLADAAAIFFTTITELRQATESTPPATLQKRLTRELNAFQQQILKHEYDDEVVLVSRYCLCATADEIIGNTAWGGNQYWDEHRLLVKLHQDPSKGKRFFPILQRVKREPEKFIDLLELIYFCLNFGFKGQYRNTLYGASQLSMIMGKTYQQIRRVRGELTTSLSPQLEPITKVSTKKKENIWHNSLITIGTTLFIIAIITSSFSFLFKMTSKQIFENNTVHSSASLTNDQNGSP